MIRLSHGSHLGKDGGCLVEVCSLLLARKIVRDGVIDADWKSAAKTDLPHCLALGVAGATQRVNDYTPEEDLWRLAPLLPGLLRARRCRDPRNEERVTQMLALWAAESVLHHVDPRLLEQCASALAHAEDLLRDDPEILDSIEWQPGFNAASSVCDLALRDPMAAIMTAPRALDEFELLLWLSDLLDAHAKALVEVGEAIDWDASYPDDAEIELVVDAILASRCNIG